MAIGVTFPFALATGSLGYFEVTNETLDAIRANAHALMSTNWGERPMHSHLGCNLRSFCFEPKTPSLQGRIAEQITSQFRQWMSFLVLDKLFVTFSNTDPTVPPDGFRIHAEFLFGNQVVVVDHLVST